jgi:phage terminase large subunit-like protein
VSPYFRCEAPFFTTRHIPRSACPKGANIFFVEDVAHQKSAIQEMELMMLPVVPMKPQGDKRARLQVVAPYINNGTVLFTRSGCEQLLGADIQYRGRVAR